MTPCNQAIVAFLALANIKYVFIDKGAFQLAARALADYP
eukprot:CAMPEP_0180370700 /NCGR_PEP_ID=MMETSP0989-20121125/19244_1 /TAXON_ID=697907 /ORGANISM="non described non described, Strain CCMP2293" /LENGTH=38 /DNA_ID= /DNA_START= /DNA_END= /DNA_ORIENTATION=